MKFLEYNDVLTIHDFIIKEYGGLNGVRDAGLLQSAIVNPQNLYFYQNADLYEIAASYAFSIIQNHPFLDGNKRSAFGSMNAFLELNEVVLDYKTVSTVEMMVKIATKEVDFAKLVKWLKGRKRL